MHLAGHKEVIELLVKRRANLKATNGKNQTPEGIAKNITTKQLLQALAVAPPQQDAEADTGQNSSPALASGTGVHASGTGVHASTAQPAMSAEITEPAADALPSATEAKPSGAARLDDQPSALAEDEGKADPAYIGPMLPLTVTLAPAHATSATGAGQGASPGQPGPRPPSIADASRPDDGNQGQAQVRQELPDGAEASNPKDSREAGAVPPDVHAAAIGAPQPQSQLPSSKAAGHVRRKRDEIEMEAPDVVPGSLASAKKAKVSLAHLGDDEEA